jgi:succinoglycan biosynthesis protein ExoA
VLTVTGVSRGETAPVAAVPVSVVVPCRNEEQYVGGVLDAIRAQDCAVAEVVVVDGGSTDATAEIVREYASRHPGFKLRVVSAYGANISAALNTGISASTAEIIVRMDSHSRPAPDYVRRAVDALRETNAAVVGGIWRVSPGAPTLMARAIARAVAHPVGAGDAAYRLNRGRVPSRREVDTVPFGCFRRSHWQQVGGFNEDLLVNEDYEFNYRTRQKGGRIVLDNLVQCEYFARPSLRALARQYFRYGWWKARMLRRHPRSIRIRQAIPALFVPGWVVVAVTALVVPALRPAAAWAVALYASLLLIAGVHAFGASRLALGASVAFLTIHSSWSAGLVSFFLTGASLTPRRQRGGRRPRAGLTGTQLLTALAILPLLAGVVPWTIAVRVHANRITRAEADVRVIATWARGLIDRLGLDPAIETVLVGPGRDPEIAAGTGWQGARTVIMSVLGSQASPVGADPWGNHYFVYLPPVTGERTQTAAVGWILSAGPNGIVETPARQSSSAMPAGDDIVFTQE